MMDPIKPLDGIAELLRKRIASEAGTRTNARKAPGAADAPGIQGLQRPSVDALRGRIAKSIESIDPQDPVGRRKITRAFVENVLSWQFGDELINDPGFAALVDEVQGTLEREPGVIDQLVETTRQTRLNF